MQTNQVLPTSRRVLAETGQKQVYQRVSGTREQITVMVCANAAGLFLPPSILFPGKRLRDIGMAEFVEAHYSMSPNGWMDSETFMAFLVRFRDCINANKIQSPVLLLVDGHSTHCTMQAATFCKDNQIILYCLVPHSSHLTQPLDVGVFGPMKCAYRKNVTAWQLQHPDQIPTKHSFPAIFKKAWKDSAIPSNAAKGFKHAGIFPATGMVSSDRLLPVQVLQSALDNLEEEHVMETEEPATQDWSSEAVMSSPPSTSASSLLSIPLPSTSTSNPSILSTPLPSTATSSSEPSMLTTPLPSTTDTPASTPQNRSSEVSPAFLEKLKVPSITPKTCKERAPKHLTGDQAMAYFAKQKIQKEEALKKKEDLIAKRQEKKAQKEMAALGKIKKPATNKDNKENELRENNKGKQCKAKQGNMRKHQTSATMKKSEQEKTGNKGKRRAAQQKPVRKRPRKSQLKENNMFESSSDSESDIEVIFDESDECNDVDPDHCPKCGLGDLEYDAWAGCDECSRWWHLHCSGDDGLIDLYPDHLHEVSQYPFTCLFCEMS
jgi:hypothetical protein